MRLDLLGQVMHVDHDALHARPRERIEQPVDQRLTTHLEQRLRRVVGQRTHPRAEAGRQHHCGMRNWNTHDRPSKTNGVVSRTKADMPASDGWERLRAKSCSCRGWKSP